MKKKAFSLVQCVTRNINFYMTFEQLISRADEETLQDILGQASLRLMSRIDPDIASPTKLKEIVTSLYSPEGLLLSPKSRALLIDLLPLKIADELSQILSINVETDPYSHLKSINIARGSEREKLLFNFFSLSPPPLEEKNEVSSEELIHVEHALFAHQIRAALEIRKYISQEPYRVMLHMPTGSGKTRTAMHIVADHLRFRENAVVIWLAYSEELCEQAALEFNKVWTNIGNRDIRSYRFWGYHDIDLENIRDGVVIAGLAKVYARAKRSIEFISKLGSRCSLVIIDEAHQAIAESYKLVLDSLIVHRKETALLGLTATPGRTWADVDADEKLSQFFSKRKVTLVIPGYDNPIDYLVSEGYLAKTEYESLFFEGLNLSDSDLERIKKDLDIPQIILNHLAEDEKRNLLIIAKIEELVKHHNRILVFSINVEHSDLLATVLRARGFHANSLTSNTPSSFRHRIIKNFKNDDDIPKILCNYGILTTGFDAPKTSAAVITRPTNSLVLYSQMIGRATRGIKAGGNKSAIIVTVVDTSLPGFSNMAEAFNNWEDIWN